MKRIPTVLAIVAACTMLLVAVGPASAFDTRGTLLTPKTAEKNGFVITTSHRRNQITYRVTVRRKKDEAPPQFSAALGVFRDKRPVVRCNLQPVRKDGDAKNEMTFEFVVAADCAKGEGYVYQSAVDLYDEASIADTGSDGYYFYLRDFVPKELAEKEKQTDSQK